MLEHKYIQEIERIYKIEISGRSIQETICTGIEPLDCNCEILDAVMINNNGWSIKRYQIYGKF